MHNLIKSRNKKEVIFRQVLRYHAGGWVEGSDKNPGQQMFSLSIALSPTLNKTVKIRTKRFLGEQKKLFK